MFRRLLIILTIGAIALVWAWLDGPAARQERGMKAAHALQLQLQPRLDADPRFSRVQLMVTTHPALFAHGAVNDEQALQDLKSIIVIPSDANYRLLFSVNIDRKAASQPNPPTTRATTTPTMNFTIEHVFYIKPPVDRVILVGTITDGTVHVGDKLVVHTAAGRIGVVVDNIESIQHGDLKQASRGQQVGLRLSGIRKDQPAVGDHVTCD